VTGLRVTGRSVLAPDSRTPIPALVVLALGRRILVRVRVLVVGRRLVVPARVLALSGRFLVSAQMILALGDRLSVPAQIVLAPSGRLSVPTLATGTRRGLSGRGRREPPGRRWLPTG
jgi:hypothetical protein